MNNSTNFQAGRWLREDGTALYIKRNADKEIIGHIENNDKLICLFEPHQSGKTSLCYRTHDKKKGVLAAVVDLQKLINYGATEMQIYFSIAREINQGLKLPDGITKIPAKKVKTLNHKISLLDEKINVLWEKHKTAPKDFWREFIKSLSELKEKIVIFIDEIGFISSVNFDFNDFFAAIAESENISVVLSGVFNSHQIGKKAPDFSILTKTIVPLKDFTEEEMSGFTEAFGQFSHINGEETMDEIYEWTNGHPYMSQRIAKSVVASFSSDGVSRVQEAVNKLFLENGIYSDVNLASVNSCFDNYISDGDRRKAALEIYEKVWKSEQPVAKKDLPNASSIDEQKLDEILDDMSISGLIVIDEKSKEIKCRNKICREIFDEQWIKTREPEKPKEEAAAPNE